MANFNASSSVVAPTHRVVLLSSHLPRQCGVASFSADLTSALKANRENFKVDPLVLDDMAGWKYPASQFTTIAIHDKDCYKAAASEINQSDADLVMVQHEYGLFGGEAGSHLLELMRAVKAPIVTTLHTVLRTPSEAQKSAMDEVLKLSDKVVVMSQTAIGLLQDVHGISTEKIALIPHGIPDISVKAGFNLRARLEVEGPMLLTFGLLSPDKGIEQVIEAMPAILKEHPGAAYFVVGATHPQVTAVHGEVYRNKLRAQAEALGIEDKVIFVDRFVSKAELVSYLGAMDFYITPYLKEDQITSGTLAYAIGAGKPVISTPYLYAKEILAEGRGVLVPFRDHESIAEAVCRLQRDPDARKAMAHQAFLFAQSMQWNKVGERYLQVMDALLERRPSQPKATESKSIAASLLPKPSFNHLVNITDDTGILQHACFSMPKREEGYCVDDNARGLLLTTMLESESSLTPEMDKLQSTYLSFVLHALNRENGRFRNFMTYDRVWLEEAGSEDSHGRSVWCLGAMIHHGRQSGRTKPAEGAFKDSLAVLERTTSPRTWAYAVLGLTHYLAVRPDDAEALRLIRILTGRLIDCYEAYSSPLWTWFEHSVTYGNARLCQALIEASTLVPEPNTLSQGLESLGWLMAIQTGPGGVFAPIGSEGFFDRGGPRAWFDQQPIEAAGSASACLSAYRITRDPMWLSEANRAFAWFRGANSLGLSMIDEEEGSCFDGLHSTGVNRNQGAESTLSYLSCLVEMRQADLLPTKVGTAWLLK